MTMSLAKPVKAHLAVRVLSLLVLGIFLIAGTHAISKGKGPATIDPSDALWSQVYDINDHGDVAGRVIRDDGSRGFVFSKGKFTAIDIPDATHTEANGINARGTIVGRYITDGFSHGFVLEDGVVTEVAVPGATFTWPTSVNDRGDIAGRYNTPGDPVLGFRGFILRKGEFLYIDFPGAQETIVSAVNNKGDAVGRVRFRDGGVGPYGPFRGFSYIDGEYSFIDVDDPDNVSTRAYGINERGDISGHYFFEPCSPCGARGFVLSKGKFTTFAYEDAETVAPRTFTFGINARGTTVGAYDENLVGGLDGTMHSFIWN